MVYFKPTKSFLQILLTTSTTTTSSKAPEEIDTYLSKLESFLLEDGELSLENSSDRETNEEEEEGNDNEKKKKEAAKKFPVLASVIMPIGNSENNNDASSSSQGDGNSSKKSPPARKLLLLAAALSKILNSEECLVPLAVVKQLQSILASSTTSSLSNLSLEEIFQRYLLPKNDDDDDDEKIKKQSHEEEEKETDKKKEQPLSLSSANHQASHNVVRICPNFLPENPHRKEMKKRVAKINRIMEETEYQILVGGLCRGGKNAVLPSVSDYKKEMETVGTTADGEFQHLHPKKETFGIFMKDVSIGLDMRLMSLAGAVVGYWLCHTRGLGFDVCMVGAAVGAIVMMFVDAILLMLRMGREDQRDKDLKKKAKRDALGGARTQKNKVD